MWLGVNKAWLESVIVAFLGMLTATLFFVVAVRLTGHGKFCGQMSCSAVKEIVIRPGTPVPIADMDCKCSRWDDVVVE